MHTRVNNLNTKGQSRIRGGHAVAVFVFVEHIKMSCFDPRAGTADARATAYTNRAWRGKEREKERAKERERERERGRE